MALNTKYLTPAEVTGFVRGRIETYTNGSSEQGIQQDVLAQILPDTSVQNIAVRFTVTDAGITPEAEYRDWDAQPAVVDLPAQKRRTIDLAALSSRIPVSESDALMSRLAGGEGYANLIKRAADSTAQSIFNTVKRQRGLVLATGKATIDQANFGLDEDFGRDAELTAALATLATNESADLIAQLQDFASIYEEKSGGYRAGAALVSTKVISAFARNKQFSSKLADGATRPATLDEVNAVLLTNDLPALVRYNEKTGVVNKQTGQRSRVAVLPEDRMIWVPTIGASDLGQTIWGLTESSFKPEFSAVGGALPGAVSAVWSTEGTAGKTVVDTDATVLPILKNANLSASLKVI